MNKLKIALGILCISMLIPACSKNDIQKRNIKLVGTPKTVETSDKEKTNPNNKDNSTKEIKSTSLENKDQKPKELKDNKNNVVEASKKVENKSTSTVTPKKELPKINYKIKSKIIVIDPGHANKADTDKEPVSPNSYILKYKQTGGAQGVSTKTPEYKINMDVALKLKSELEAKGFVVIMTKIDNSKTMSNIERAKLGNKANAALVIRIHADSADNKSAKGASMLVPANNEYTKGFYNESKSFGQVILNTVINNVGMKNRGVIERNDMTGFNWSTVPVVLIEMGFLSNSEEDRNLSNATYQEKIAKSISEGVMLLSNM
jgi:N-acetylmuramoyl-L-alanine amidase